MIITAFGLAFIFSYVIDSSTINILRQASNIKSSSTKIDVNKNDMSVDGWDVDRNLWIAIKDSPEITIKDINMQVDYVAVIFSESLDWQTSTHILKN